MIPPLAFVFSGEETSPTLIAQSYTWLSCTSVPGDWQYPMQPYGHDKAALLGFAVTGPGFAPELPAFVAFAQVSADDGPSAPLWSDEEALVHPRAVAARRLDFRMGRAAAHQALRSLGQDSAPIMRGDHGEPVWPKGIVGSITHTTGHALCVVAYRDQCGGLGLDVEHRERQFPQLAQHVATAEEEGWLGALPGAGRRQATLELFSAKESIYKAFFPRVGRFFGFEAAHLAPVPTGGYEARFVEPLDDEYPPDRTFDIGCVWNGEFVLTSLVLPP